MPPNLIFFTGSPPANSLKWEENSLLTTFIDPIARFANLDTSEFEQSTIPNSVDEHPAWRSIPLVRKQLRTGFTQSQDQHQMCQGGWDHGADETSASFFTTSQVESLISEMSQQEIQNSISSHQSIEDVLTKFYEESYQRHEDILSSQIALASFSDAETSFNSDEYSYESTSFDSFARSKGAVPVAGHLSNLKDMPNARYLDSIQPATMTVNLIVGIISIPPARNITTRRGAGVELVEVLVGDETKSGFGVNFWLSSSNESSGKEGDMRSVLDGLRPQDVVLMKNVALSSFKGRFYGQSLRKEMTKVFLLYRNRVDRDDLGGCYSAGDLVLSEHASLQVEKTRRVREWVLRFVGVGAGAEGGRAKRDGRLDKSIREVLPPDTQDTQ